MVNLPIEVRNAIKTLQDDTRIEILLTLSENGEMSFSPIGHSMGLSSSGLTYHLQPLKESALIENFFKKVENVDSHSFYRVTEFGERLIDSLFRILNPGPVLVEYSKTYEREITIREKWEDRIKYSKIPPPVLEDEKGAYSGFVMKVLEVAANNE